MQPHSPRISERWFPRPLTLYAYFRVLPISFAFWTLVVVLKGGQVLMNDASLGYVLPLQHYFVWAGLDLYSWALFTPLIFALAFRFPFTRSKWIERLVSSYLRMCGLYLCAGTRTRHGRLYLCRALRAPRAVAKHGGR